MNIDPTAKTHLGKYLHPFYSLSELDSALGFNYRSLRAVEKFLKIKNPDQFKHILSLNITDSRLAYKNFLRSVDYRYDTVPHIRTVIMFLIWERLNKDEVYRNNFIRFRDIVISNNENVYCRANLKNTSGEGELTYYDNWFPGLLKYFIDNYTDNDWAKIPDFTVSNNKRFHDVYWESCVPSNTLTEKSLVKLVIG